MGHRNAFPTVPSWLIVFVNANECATYYNVKYMNFEYEYDYVYESISVLTSDHVQDSVSHLSLGLDRSIAALSLLDSLISQRLSGSDFDQLLRLGVNLKKFPTSTVPATFAILFHVGIGAVLSLYLLSWLKLDLFTTLKALGFLGIFLMFVGHKILSHLASTSAKLKSA
ncbi:uncharacterized protein LOC114320586 [Camellia sinensis]|uniref:uncharacterized protein LOC114320586 n=1 Tax=Camellia sinensis TaxID=4442 RepID=UPI001035E416|nr:uncharacterized protein LOC114320586 [Camellia sinensis]